MKITMLRTLVLTSLAVSVVNLAHANGFSWQVQGGPAWTRYNGSTQNLTLDQFTVNQYTVNAPSQTHPLIGVGINYQWDYKNLAFNLGLSADHTRNTISGINSPFINGGNFDTLTYSASDTSYALMLEPKFIWTAHAIQPYVLAGAGVAFNHAYGYSETQTDPNGFAVPTDTPFNSETMRNFAYEAGLGLQFPFTLQQNAMTIAVDYRYMDWGKVGLSTYTNQPTSDKLSFGRLRTNSANLSLIFPF